MMDVKTFCIIAMDNIKGLSDDLGNISVEPVKVLKGRKDTALVATFKTELDISRVKEILNIGNRSFFISEMNNKTFTAHIDDREIHNVMFNELDVENQKGYEDENEKKVTLKDSYDEKELSSLDDKERSLLMDKLLNNINELTVNQKEALSFLATL
jgi:hypothetical protein